jgi:hypothetical protein
MYNIRNTHAIFVLLAAQRPIFPLPSERTTSQLQKAAEIEYFTGLHLPWQSDYLVLGKRLFRHSLDACREKV